MIRLFIILAMCLSCHAQTEADTERRVWNSNFTDETFHFNRDANRFLQQVTAHLEPGLVLDIGMGQGRNSLFLAEQGWKVTGIDVADEAVALAKQQAAKKGLELNALVENVDTYEYGIDKWDLVIGMYMHNFLTRNVEKIIASIKPGGLLLIEGFHWDVSKNRGSITTGKRFGYKTNELTEVFGKLRILYYEDVTDKADFISDEDHPIVRLLARRIE